MTPAAISLQADLEAIRKLLLQREGAVINVTADERGLTAAEGDIQGFLESLPTTSGQNADWSNSLPLLNEAITVPTQVQTKDSLESLEIPPLAMSLQQFQRACISHDSFKAHSLLSQSSNHTDGPDSPRNCVLTSL